MTHASCLKNARRLCLDSGLSSSFNRRKGGKNHGSFSDTRLYNRSGGGSRFQEILSRLQRPWEIRAGVPGRWSSRNSSTTLNWKKNAWLMIRDHRKSHLWQAFRGERRNDYGERKVLSALIIWLMIAKETVITVVWIVFEEWRSCVQGVVTILEGNCAVSYNRGIIWCSFLFMGRFRGTRIERLGCRKCYIFRVLMLLLINRFVWYWNSIIYLSHNTRVTIEISNFWYDMKIYERFIQPFWEFSSPLLAEPIEKQTPKKNAKLREKWKKR